MKHLKHVSKEIPARAQFFDFLNKEEHPGVLDSIQGLFADPLGTLNLHFRKPAC